MPPKNDLLQRTLDLLILKTLALGPLHGWGVARRIRQLSGEVLEVQQGSLYPALYRLQERGLVRSKTGESEGGRPVRIYQRTAGGKKRLEAEESSWRKLSAAVDLVLEAT